MIQRARAATVLVFLSVCAQGVAGPSATIVILAPHVKAGDAKVHAAAELLCDRLAEKLAKAAGVRVVDRTQIDRVLAEHKQSPLPPKPILSYDAMVRLVADNSGPVPRVEVALIDLSMGNVIGAKQYAWTGGMDEKLVPTMAELCASAARKVPSEQDGRIKVRVVSPVIAENVARLEPLVKRLEDAFAASLGRSAKLCQVYHLEAASAAEESLLLLMGMSRLPGGRQFAPQADAVIQSRLSEVDPLGKAFEQTTVRLDYCVDAPARGRWQHVKGKVADWDRLIASAWQGVAERLAGADPKAARDFLNEVALRRRQARAEMGKLHSLGAHKYCCCGDIDERVFPTGRVKLIADTAAAAAKLDPTNEEAARISILFNFALLRGRIRSEQADPRATMTPMLSEALRHFRTYKDWRQQNAELAYEAINWVLIGNDTKLKYGRLTQQKTWFRYTSDDPPALSVLEVVRELADEGLSVPSGAGLGLWESGCQIRLIYERMLAAALSPDKCRRWRDQAARKAEENALKFRQSGRGTDYSFHRAVASLRCIRIGWAIDEGHPDEARQMLLDLMERMGGSQPFYSSVRAGLVKHANRLNDPDLAGRVKQWLKHRSWHPRTGQVELLYIRWPARQLHGEVPRTTSSGPITVNFKAAASVKAHRGSSNFEPVGIVDRRLYLLFTTESNLIQLRPGNDRFAKFSYQPVGQDGRPAGTELVLLPSPEVRRESKLLSAAVLDRKLCLGTSRSGLLVYDPRAGKWKIYGPDEGLPSRCIARMYALDDESLLCYGYVSRRPVTWTLDLATGEVVVRGHRIDDRRLDWGIWRYGHTYRAVNSDGVIEDALGKWPAVTAWPKQMEQGWPRSSIRELVPWYPLRPGGPMSVSEVAGRRFVDMPEALRQIDARGKILRTWPKTLRLHIVGKPLTHGAVAGKFEMTVPGLLPAGAVLAHDNSVIWYQAERRLLCYEPAQDTWYGPLHAKELPSFYPVPALVVEAGIWLAWGPPAFVSKDAFIDHARRRGLVLTSAEWAQRNRRTIDASPPLARAKFTLGTHDFEKARTLLAEILKIEPSHPEALALMGMLHDKACLNRPTEALKYYRRLADVEDDPSAVLTGLYLQCQCHWNAGDLGAALRASQKALEVPELFPPVRLTIDDYRTRIAATIRRQRPARSEGSVR